MDFKVIDKNHWKEVKKIYLEAFPKSEQKPFFLLKRSVKNGKAQIYTAVEDEMLLGFVMTICLDDLVMVDYLAVSNKIRSKGTGSFIMQNICKIFNGKKIVLLIEKLDDTAENKEQRIARKRFYLKNGFNSSGIFVNGVSGKMEVMNFGEKITKEEYLRLQKYALGSLFFKLSKMKLIEE